MIGFLILCWSGFVTAGQADLTEGDPLQSMVWPDIKMEFFESNAKIKFDDRIQVNTPQFAEDAMNVPVSFDASALGEVTKVVVIVDRNPIRKVLEFVPHQIKPSLHFRFKLQQASPIRVAALTPDGIWHVGGAFIQASGGGCTVPGATRADGTWSSKLNQVSGKLFDRAGQSRDPRLRVQISHPMDTGLVAGIPAFYIEELTLRDAGGKALATIYPFEPVSENPLFSFDFKEKPQAPLNMIGKDNNGNKINGKFLP